MMASPSIKENEEQFTGMELDEPEEESREMAEAPDQSGEKSDKPLDALDELWEESDEPGEAMDEPAEKSPETAEAPDESGKKSDKPLDALDELWEESGEPGEALDEPAEESGEPGEALDEPGADLNESREEWDESEEGEDSEESLGKPKSKKILWLLIAMGLCLLAGGGYFFLKGGKPDGSIDESVERQVKKREAVPQQNIPYRPRGYSLKFGTFLIPVQKKNGFAYITFSVSFYLPSRELKKEMIENKIRLRAVIYDAIREEVNKTKAVPPSDEVRSIIIAGINKVLSTGEVQSVDIPVFRTI